MKKTKLILSLMAIIAIMSAGYAQQKYAVIITGDYNPDQLIIPLEDQWNEGDGIGQYGFDEMWNDCYLMWEMLVIKKEYTDENVHVLFANGDDFIFPGQDIRYKAINHQGYTKVTDDMSTEEKVNNVFTNLANTITENDFLYVWIMSHGGDNNPGENNGNAYLYLYGYPDPNPDYDGLLYDDELKAYLDNINALKKVVFIQAPHSGRFADKLHSDNTIVFTSSDKSELSRMADFIQ